MSDKETMDAIQQRMREVRGSMGEDVNDIVASTRDMTDWRKYVRANPWICLAAAAAVGYTLVPRRTATSTGVSESQLKSLIRDAIPNASQPKPSRLRSELFSFVTHAAVRAFMGYLGNQMAASSMAPDVPDHAAVRRTPK